MLFTECSVSLHAVVTVKRLKKGQPYEWHSKHVKPQLTWNHRLGLIIFIIFS